jgi:hypothetical protein
MALKPLDEIMKTAYDFGIHDSNQLWNIGLDRGASPPNRSND